MTEASVITNCSAFNFERYHVGGLSKDVWVLIGQHSNVFTKIQIASTCTKLRELYSNRFDLARWGKLKFPDRLYQSLIVRDYELFAFCSKRMGNAIDPMHYYKVCLNQASLENRRDVVDICINKITEDEGTEGNGAYVTSIEALERAAKGGHLDLVDYFITIWDITEKELCFGLWGAASGGHKDLCEFFISKGAHGLRMAAYNASQNGHRKLAEELNKIDM